MAKTSYQILVVDDNPVLLEIVEQGLVEEGYSVVTVEKGADAIALARQKRFDLIVLDAKMPGMNGFDVLHHLASDPVTASIPVMMLTVFNRKEGIDAALKLGAKDYMAKPFDIGNLITRLERLLVKFPQGPQP